MRLAWPTPAAVNVFTVISQYGTLGQLWAFGQGARSEVTFAARHPRTVSEVRSTRLSESRAFQRVIWHSPGAPWLQDVTRAPPALFLARLNGISVDVGPKCDEAEAEAEAESAALFQLQVPLAESPRSASLCEDHSTDFQFACDFSAAAHFLGAGFVDESNLTNSDRLVTDQAITCWAFRGQGKCLG